MSDGDVPVCQQQDFSNDSRWWPTCEGACKGVELGAVAHQLASSGHLPLHGVATDEGAALVWHCLTCVQMTNMCQARHAASKASKMPAHACVTF